MRDPYSVLGVQRNADADEIKAAWRSKAKSVHPDHNQSDPGASSRFAEVGRAYEVLKDPERRKRYDRAVDAHQTILQQRQAAREAAERAKAAKANAEKVMEELARANAQRAQAQANAKAAAPETEAAEDMVERIFGAAKDAGASADEGRTTQDSEASRKAQPQPSSFSSGSAAGTDKNPSEGGNIAPEPRPLPVQAVDLIASLVRRIRGVNAPPEKAPDHAVEAHVSLEELLKQSWVAIKLPEDREVHFRLEPGMTAGHVARLKGQGLKVPGMLRGDLLVTLKLVTDAKFRVEGYDIHTIMPISLEDAVLGTETQVETPEGPRQITVPPWSGSDRAIELEELGLADGEGNRGKLVVELRVMLWEKPDAKVTDLMRHMREGLYV